MNVAVIPARGGSKRIPRKNIKDFHGKPILAWSIKVALQCGLFDRVLVSTDDEEIARIAQQFGAEVPFLRPDDLADDFTTTVEVIAHAARWLESDDSKTDTICCIYPTAPFLDVSDLTTAWHRISAGGHLYVVSATLLETSIYRSFETGVDGQIELVFPEHLSTRSQDLPLSWCDAGMFYWGTSEAWLARKGLLESHSVVTQIPRWRVVDIDTVEDWERAELMAPLVFDRIHSC
ncbi:pseudaminic acid cytidylyltransferase [Arenicella xantha]|uniref:N-acylneuraminate cytidylyltransferase n=1 Tax=Arenicella xantha TaxID=644221 RepID=A0A395JIJ5_9GAMM|nr:pseudaminic acid cytidylyltransferase [Arenicella xantha]RBP49886.1 N-acylneuraminate cytidylyltransferase [Arenicella xantha]